MVFLVYNSVGRVDYALDVDFFSVCRVVKADSSANNDVSVTGTIGIFIGKGVVFIIRDVTVKDDHDAVIGENFIRVVVVAIIFVVDLFDCRNRCMILLADKDCKGGVVVFYESRIIKIFSCSTTFSDVSVVVAVADFEDFISYTVFLNVFGAMNHALIFRSKD